ncbi:MAG: electron transfer flavoprotein subunit beta/FixA family protein [Dehalococcoidales bacterium]|nr:electron transfer flavoprotein subunit beta/FixA family protein [Dehalococcoidales bacterium]
MDIIVLVKRVPDTSEADIVFSPDSRSIVEKDLVFDINESDKYAVEAAVQLKEKLGGTVTAITMGETSAEDVLRRCLATGIDRAIRLTDPAFTGSDAAATARALAGVIKSMQYDMVLTGVQANDSLQAQIGVTVAGMLGLPHSTLVNKLEINGNIAKVHRELEGGLEDVLEVKLPALFTIQTGINEPRYVSIMGIRKASRLEIKVSRLSDTGLDASSAGEPGSLVKLEKLYIPPSTKATEILSGTIEEMASKLAGIIKEKGGLS